LTLENGTDRLIRNVGCVTYQKSETLFYTEEEEEWINALRRK
jgi:hypothetical protein